LTAPWIATDLTQDEQAAQAFTDLDRALHALADVPHRFVGPWLVDLRFDRPSMTRRERDGATVAEVVDGGSSFRWVVRYAGDSIERTETSGTAARLDQAFKVCDLLLTTGGDVLVGSQPGPEQVKPFADAARAYRNGVEAPG